MNKFKNRFINYRHIITSKRRNVVVSYVLFVTLIASLMAPVFQKLELNRRYTLNSNIQSLIGKSSPILTKKISIDATSKAIIFNKDGQISAKDSLMSSVGSAAKKSEQIYSATMPSKLTDGIKFENVANGVSVSMVPQFSAREARLVDGHVVYPLDATDDATLMLTPKSNGLKEDIILRHSIRDTMEFSYQLQVPETLEARIMSTGAVGFYSGDPALFGNINFGTKEDKDKVEKARKVSEKSYLMFEIPAPVIRQSGKGSTATAAHFELKGLVLTVIAKGLAKASYPLSIDPTFVITSASDFNSGRIEDNISVTTPGATDGQLNRAAITGGLINSSGWAPAVAGNLPVGCSNAGTDYQFGMTAYNGFLYLVGGGDGAQTYTCYVAINSNGTLGTWFAAANAFATGRTGAAVVGYNGYLYIIGGESANGGTQYATVEYSAIQSTGNLGTWATTSSTVTGRAYLGAAIYNDFIYVCGGAGNKNNGLLKNTCEYVNIKADGTLGTWVQSSSAATGTFTTAVDRMGFGAYNNYLYLVGGFNGTVAVSTVQYVPIKSDGSIGTWVSTTSMPGVRRSGGVALEQGYIYSYAGCSTGPACSGLLSSTVYAPINADGSIGAWDTTASITTARIFNGAASYNGVLYMVGGCLAEPTNNNNCSGTEMGDSQYAVISTTPGDVVTPSATASSLTAARSGVASVAYNGYLYSAGGCNGASCATMTTTVDFATVNDDGTVGTWAATTAGLPAARYGGAMVGFGGKVYFVGGDTGAGAGSTVVYSATPSSGNIAAWTTETNTFSSPRYYLTASVFANYIYIVGGTGTGGPFATVEYTQLVNGAWTSPANCVSNGGTLTNNWCKSGNSFTTARYGHGAVAYNGNLYLVAGVDGGGSLLSDSQKSALGSADGYPAAFTSSGQAALPTPATDTTIGHRFVSATVHNSVLYVYGGLNNSVSAATTINYAPLDTSGNVSAWTKSGRALVTARWGAGSAAYNGVLYTTGGCSSSAAPPCTAYLASAEYFNVRNGGRGVTTIVNAGTWTATTALATGLADFMSVAYNGNVYVIGGCTIYTSGTCSTWSSEVRHSTIASDGTLGAWTATTGVDTQLATARSWAGISAYNGKIYIVGGSKSGTAQDTTVLYGTLNSAGTITSWTTDPGTLPSGRSGFGMATSGGYLYVAGGLNPTPTRQNNVLYTQINSTTGALTAPACSGPDTLSGVWCTSSKTFTTARQELVAIAYNSVLYVYGGYDGTNNLGDVQYATLSTSTGALGNFTYTNYQDRAARARQAVAANGYLYYFGNENSASDVNYTALNANNTVGNLYRASSTGMATANHTHGSTVFYNGYFYALGGCTLSSGQCGATVNTNSEYVGQKATARVGHYSKLFNTQVDTAPSQFQLNGSQASGDSAIRTIIRTAATGQPLGSAQTFNPTLLANFYTLQALDSTGSNTGVAFIYYIFITLDDSSSGTFPDATVGATSTTVTDFTIFYHANPSRRLKHGASFTNTGCNTIAANGCILDTAP